MVEGEVEVTDSFTAFLFVWASWDNLIFRRGSDRRLILGSKDKRVGFHCTGCGACLITQEESGFRAARALGRSAARLFRRRRPK